MASKIWNEKVKMIGEGYAINEYKTSVQEAQDKYRSFLAQLGIHKIDEQGKNMLKFIDGLKESISDPSTKYGEFSKKFTNASVNNDKVVRIENGKCSYYSVQTVSNENIAVGKTEEGLYANLLENISNMIRIILNQ